MIVVADSSVLIALSAIGQLSVICARCPDGVLVPSAVWREVVEEGRDRPGAREISTAKWISMGQIKDNAFVQYLKMGLDDGEAEAIGLAREVNAGLVLLDERAARDVAKGLGLKVLGTIGLLIWAKRAGRVKNLRQLLDRLQGEANFRIGKTVYANALQEADE